jgi:hypothetical protein
MSNLTVIFAIVTNCLVQSPTWQDDSFWGEKYPQCVEPNIRSRTHNSLSLVTILGEMKPVYAVPSSFFKVNFNILSFPRSSKSSSSDKPEYLVASKRYL